MEKVIKTEQLYKKIKNDYIIHPMDFELSKGEICALIGQNGAGKSTFFKLLANQLYPSSGSIEFFGIDPDDNPEIRKNIGFMIESPIFIDHFTAFQNLKYFSIQRGVFNKEHIMQLMQQVGLRNSKKKVSQFSLGMKQRLNIALALLNGPDLLVLDEPINGIDAQGIKDFRELILKLNEEKGITILISSHILNELQQLATTFVFLENGYIQEKMTKEQLLQKGKKALIIKVDNIAKASQIIDENYENIDIKILPDNIIKINLQNDVDYSEINELLIHHHITVNEFKIETTNLEDYFLDVKRGEHHD